MVKGVFSFIYEYNLKVYISVQNKIEFIIDQIIKKYCNNFFVDADIIRYTVTQLLNIYSPKDVIDSIYRNEGTFINELRKFCFQLQKKNSELLLRKDLLKQRYFFYSLEALIRWNHPERGLLMPGDFIPLIEETQLIHQLTEWVLFKVIDKIREFRKEGYDVVISMNISVKNILDKDVYWRIADIINANRDVVNNLEFEIMETILMETLDETLETIRMYRELGISFAVDDFGKGYSSLAYLHRLPIECVKIDRGFISNLIEDKASQKILRSVISLCHALNYRVVIEGVEDETTAVMARNLECDYAQGFYFARPIDAAQIIAWMKSKNEGTPA